MSELACCVDLKFLWGRLLLESVVVYDRMRMSTTMTVAVLASQAAGPIGEGVMTTHATLPNAFTRAAINFMVAESDFLVMSHLGVDNFEAMTYRLPKSEDLDDFMRTQILPRAGYREEDGNLLIFQREPADTWASYRVSEDAGAIRKLWSFAKEVCKAELEAMASGDTGKVKPKANVATATAMENKAIKEADMPPPGSDSERPSLFALTKTSQSLVAPGATYEYTPWECYISMEEEGRLVRMGKMPKTSAELVLSKGENLAVREKSTDEVPGREASDMELFRGYLDVRARAIAMVGAATYKTYRMLTDVYVSKLTASVASGMRSPTINEVRKFDRALHEQVLRWLSQTMGSLDDAIGKYLGANSHPLWRLLDPVMESLPDQGIEKAGKDGQNKKRKPGDDDETSEAPVEPKKGGAAKKRCLVCGKKHTPLCQLTKEVRARLKAEKKAKDADQKKKKAEAKKDAKGHSK